MLKGGIRKEDLNNEHKGKLLRICCATETLAASINSSTI
jgi:hypothetical protein